MNRKLTFEVFVTLVIVTILSIGIFGKIDMNGGQTAFPQNNRSVINTNMEMGSALFFYGDSYIRLFLHQIESSMDYKLMQQYITLAVTKLYEAYGYYNTAYGIAKNMYEKPCIDKLKNFDYSTIKSQYKYDYIFNKIMHYFLNGDVIGAYKQNLDYLTEIIIKLNLINNNLKENILNIKNIQELSELIYERGYYGNYFTRIFTQATK